MKIKPLTLFAIGGIVAFTLSCSSHSTDRISKELMDADLAFSRASVETGRNRAFLEFCAEDGVMLRENSKPVEGKSRISELLSKPDTAYTLTWAPEYGFGARSGELGYTYGIWTLTIKASGDKSYGTYVTIWKKDGKGQWKWALDKGNEGIGE
jgi:ketosteroid isomerase-like protein